MTTGAPSSYTTSTITVEYTGTRGDVMQTDIFPLPPQTTQWVAPTSCKTKDRPVVCSSKGDWFDKCHEYESADAFGNVYIGSSCYPPGYRDIFSRKSSIWSDIATAAYPGTACPSGWSVPSDSSCKQNIIRGSIHYSQAWCCPQGFNSCVFNSNTRNCYMQLTSATQIWTPTTRTTTVSGVTTVAQFATAMANADSQKPLHVYHAVFPLAITSTTASAGPEFTDKSGPVSPDGGGNGNGSSSTTVQIGLPPAIVAGIVIGVVAGLALIAAILIFLFMRRRRATEVRHSILPHRTATSTPGLPEDGSGGVSYDPFAPGQTTPGLYGGGDPKMLTAAPAVDPIVSRWHSPATVGAYAATARSASPYDLGDPNSQGVELVEQMGQMEAVVVDDGGTATTWPQTQPQPEEYYTPHKPNIPPGNVELAELESHPVTRVRVPVEIDSNPSVMSYEPTPVTAAPFSAVTTSVSPLRNPEPAVTIIPPPSDGDNRRHF
ncbi:hypothetical protein RB600_004711 [Gaeumannomyces tritici]